MTPDYGDNKPPTKAQVISDSPRWTAVGRLSSIISAAAGVIGLALLSWNFYTLVQVDKTATMTAVQLEDFKQDAERSRADVKDKLATAAQASKEKFDGLTAWVARLAQRVDALRPQ